MTRDHALYCFYMDFTAAARAAAQAIIDGNIPSINPTDEPINHMFLVNNIFFSRAVNWLNYYREYGSHASGGQSVVSEAVSNRANNELKVNTRGETDIKGGIGGAVD